MDVDRGFLGGFLVLGLAIFVAGFLTGMLAIAMIPMSADAGTAGFISFTLGYVMGMLTIALVLVVLQFSNFRKRSQ